MSSKVYNIPYGAPFLEIIAQRFLENYKDKPFELCDVVFLMPNRRSCQNLKEAFLQKNGLSPFLLPKIVPVQDVDEDEIFFEDMTTEDLPAAISNEERTFLFSKMIASKKNNYNLESISLAQSLSLAEALGKLIDMTYQEKISFENLEKIVPSEYAAHWQETLRFLKIVTSFWPSILQERNMIDGADKKSRLMELKAKSFIEKNKDKKIVAAGVGVPFESLKKLLQSVFELSNGEIYIYGLDRHISDKDWDELLSETHPQFEKKELLKALKIDRSDVEDVTQSLNVLRETFVSEVMRQAETTGFWRHTDENLKEALKGLKLIEASDSFEEAKMIALILREVLEKPQKTAALVTTDRTLARMVCNELKRFDVEIDDSAGLPLHLSPIGIYLRQILDVLDAGFSRSSLASLKKNPFFRLGKNAQEIRQTVREAEMERRLKRYKQEPIRQKEDAIDTIIKKEYEPLKLLYDKKEASFSDLLKEHIALAERLASDELQDGACNLWRHEDGRLCANVLAGILDKADILGDVVCVQYSAAFVTLLSKEMVRKPYGSHPRIKILGPIEARFSSFDVMIAGSLNEGVWPQIASADPFMSRPMKKDFGLPLPEKSIGVFADDLSAILNAKEVFLTRSERNQGTPMSKSRYWLRIETVLKAMGLEPERLCDGFYAKTALKTEGLDGQLNLESVAPVAPRPPLQARPRKFSASALKTLMESPYDIYASRILKLKPLKAMEEELDVKDFGTIMHRVLEKFCLKYPSQLDENVAVFLRETAKEELEKSCLDNSKKVFWSAMADKAVDFVLETEKTYRQNVLKVTPEVEGETVLKTKNSKFVLTATADRIDETKDGFYNVLDYKTGTPPKTIDVLKGYFPQLPLEAIIAQEGGFERDGKKLEAKNLKELIYWGIGKGIVLKIGKSEAEIQNLLNETKERIKMLLEAFDDEKTPYLYNPNPKHVNSYSDYEHLARYKEWKGQDKV